MLLAAAGLPTFDLLAGVQSMQPNLPGRAVGGPVTSQQPYMVGERGPELFVPGTGGSVVSNGDLRSAMNGGSGGASGSPVLNMSFQSTSINGVEYVSRDQLESAMAETRRNATRDGAKRGMTMTLDRIQNSSSTRRKVGI
jgi:phage-related minor tail protein